MNLKRIFALLAVLLLLLCGCGKETKTVSCDRCGKELTIDADSNMDDSWIIFCETCEQEAFGGTGVVDPN